MQKIFNHKSFNYLVWTPLVSIVNLRNIFAFKFTLRSQQPDVVPIICISKGAPLVSLILVSTTLAKLVAKFAVGVTLVANLPPVSLNWWCTFTCEYLREFSKKIETVLMGYSGAGGKLIHEKNQKQKIL
jgi:hypothetical protein